MRWSALVMMLLVAVLAAPGAGIARAQSASNAADTDPHAAMALRAMAMWNPPSSLYVNSGHDADDGVVVWNAAPDGLGGLFTFGHVLHVPGYPDLASSTGYRDLIATYREAFPDLMVTVDDVVSAGNTVALRWTMEGTHTGTFGGIEPTGNAFRIVGVTLFRVADGHIRETWFVPDGLGLLNQLGAITEA